MAKVMRVLCPENYDALYDGGITSKQMLRERLHELAVVQPLQAKADVTQGMVWPGDLRGGSRLLNLSSLDIVVAGAPAGNQEKLTGGLAVLGGLYSVRRIFPVSRKYVLAIY